MAHERAKYAVGQVEEYAVREINEAFIFHYAYRIVVYAEFRDAPGMWAQFSITNNEVFAIISGMSFQQARDRMEYNWPSENKRIGYVT
jgi:hypothetical protein